MAEANGHTKALVWSLASLFGVIIGALWVIFIKDTGALREAVASLEASRLEAAHEDGVADTTRAKNVSDVAALQGESKALDDRLQREMRDLNSAIIAESRAVDERLQAEIRNLNLHVLAGEAAAAQSFERIEMILTERAERLASLRERMIAVERAVYGPELTSERK